MENDSQSKNPEIIGTDEEGLLSRRIFFNGLGKWSKIVLGATVLGGALLNAGHEAGAAGAAWANRGGGGAGAWANRGGGGTAGWANRSGGSAAWANRGAGWSNRGGSWVNRY